MTYLRAAKLAEGDDVEGLLRSDLGNVRELSLGMGDEDGEREREKGNAGFYEGWLKA